MEVSGQFHVSIALPSEKSPITHWIGRRMNPKAGMDAVEHSKTHLPPPRIYLRPICLLSQYHIHLLATRKDRSGNNLQQWLVWRIDK
jgi:hypothetical protein